MTSSCVCWVRTVGAGHVLGGIRGFGSFLSVLFRGLSQSWRVLTRGCWWSAGLRYSSFWLYAPV